MTNIESDLQQYLVAEQPNATKGKNTIALNEPLVSSGRIDSLGLLQLLDFIHDRYGVDLLGATDPERFDTIETLAEAVREVQGG